MHEYIISSHDRKYSYYFIAIISGLFGVGIAFLINAIKTNYGIIVAAPSGLAIFGLIFFLFDHFIWKYPPLYILGLVKIPNLNGDWVATISPSEAGNKISAKVKIHQTYSKIGIHLETDQSNSLSKMATIEMAHPTMFTLRYEYSAEFQRDEQSTILRHYGVTSIRLKSDDHHFLNEHLANYYTEQGRDSHGEIVFKKVAKK